MSKQKITIQDIADSLGLSRNTVSKSLNENESIPESTRKKVMAKAIELKYKHFGFMNTENLMREKKGNIALLTCDTSKNSNFGSLLMSGLEKKLSTEGYNLSIHILREIEINSLTLPKNFELNNVDGIVCRELFDKDYTYLVSNLGIPTIFVDSIADIFYPKLNTDIILMENKHSTYSVTKTLIDSGHTKLGFIGDYTHCKSFNERWAGFNRALLNSNLQLDLSFCIVENDSCPYSDYNWMKSKLDNMDALPSAFICANDYIAINVIKALKGKNIKIPEDILVSGFDDSQESLIVDPPLTTVHIFSCEMGGIAAELLLSRLKNQSKPFQITHVKTEPIFRESTGNLR
jgi:LacI family transcriptional regulator